MFSPNQTTIKNYEHHIVGKAKILEGAKRQPGELANDGKCSNGRIKVFVVLMDQFIAEAEV